MAQIVKRDKMDVKGKVVSIRSNGRSESDNRSVIQAFDVYCE